MVTRRITLADEDWPAVREVAGLDVDIPAMARCLRSLAPSVGQPERAGPSAVCVRLYNSKRVCCGSVLASQADWDGVEWIHASIARENHMPVYTDLACLHEAVFGPDRYAFQVFAPRSAHVNIHAHALHLWGRADGVSPLPEFGKWGTI